MVIDIVYKGNTSPSHRTKFIMVHFGSQYTGTTFFPDDETRKGWVPVHPVMATQYTSSRAPGQYDEHTCTIFLLKRKRNMI
eukprot:7035909-Ditylum_brightwellii.AAC.1